MSSNRPYLIRAMYDWISDNGLTPYLLVDARIDGVRVPAFAVKDGQIVLNVAMRAVADLELGNERVRFRARFSGASHDVIVPIADFMRSPEGSHKLKIVRTQFLQHLLRRDTFFIAVFKALVSRNVADGPKA